MFQGVNLDSRFLGNDRCLVIGLEWAAWVTELPTLLGCWGPQKGGNWREDIVGTGVIDSAWLSLFNYYEE